jgi:hypothetical protein
MSFIFQLYQSGPFRFPSAFWGNSTIFLGHSYLIHCNHTSPATQNFPTKSVRWFQGMRNIDIAFRFLFVKLTHALLTFLHFTVLTDCQHNDCDQEEKKEHSASHVFREKTCSAR